MADRDIAEAVLRRKMGDGGIEYKLSLDDYGGMEVLIKQQDDGSLAGGYAWAEEAKRLPPKWVGIPTSNPAVVNLTRSFLVSMQDEILRQIAADRHMEGRSVFNAMNNAPSAAHYLVDRVLDEYHSNDDVPPGSKDDPWRQTTSPMKFSAKDFTGKRNDITGKKPKEDDEEAVKEEPKPRFKLKFEARAARLLDEIAG